MKKILLILFCSFLLNSISINGYEYITGNGFRNCADYKIDEERCTFDPAQVPYRSVIYVESNFLEYFFKEVFPRLTHPIILLTHNADWPAPGKFASYLDDQKIIIWFGQNCDIKHCKFYPIPIGIANAKWPHGNTKILDEVLEHIKNNSQTLRSKQLYINFSTGTNPVRSHLHQLLRNQSFVFFDTVHSFNEYLLRMSHYYFVLSPFGNGLDCHRTWEALLMGCTPVVQTSTLDPLYENLPVIIIQDWNEITEELLATKYKEISQKKYNTEKLFLEYWINLINKIKNEGKE